MDLRVIPADDSPAHVNEWWFLERAHNLPFLRYGNRGSPVARTKVSYRAYRSNGYRPPGKCCHADAPRASPDLMMPSPLSRANFEALRRLMSFQYFPLKIPDVQCGSDSESVQWEPALLPAAATPERVRTPQPRPEAVAERR
jgi:hypothetical protein